ncbi:Cytochrome P450 71A9 [Platanthera zijinensis]|uniref:Cytochrome P450 71A9 n=1 Tax=Platanthera zijinensis TaxID=2320716 RepID=A0AAP0GEC8_9ASPA
MVFALSYNVMCRTVFGDRHGGGAGVYHGRRNWFREVMAETQAIVAEFCAADFFPGWDWIDSTTGHRARLERNFVVVNGIYERVIEEHLRRGKEEDDGDRREEDLVDVLLRSHGEAGDGGFPASMDYVKGIMADMLFGGTDTTSATIIWTMTELMKNPRVMAKLKQELEDVIGNKSKVEETDLEQLQYLKLVIKEALRLHPPSPLLIPRETLEPCKIEGYDIPAKTLVFINASAIARDPKTWKNHNEFCPERFDLVGVDSKGQDCNYVPFGVGRRSCPGADFGAVVMELVLANLLYCFAWCLPDGMMPRDVDMEGARGLTMHKKVPLCLIAKSKSLCNYSLHPSNF